MSAADKIFKDMCRDILENGTSTEGEKVRPHWPDGTSAYTIKRFGVINRYDLRTEFPALTLRKTAIKSATDELLWIWQKKSNNINELNSHIWDEWADETGSIGEAYGFQMGKKYVHHNADSADDELKKIYPSIEFKERADGRVDVLLDQTDGVLYDLRNNPFSRRIMTNIYNHEDLCRMNLYPCAYSMTFNVTADKASDKLVLNAILNQRSQDVLAANNWNVCQYSMLVMMFAQVCDMIPGEFVHVISDAHIYDRHVDIIRELISREEYPAPRVTLNPEIKDFYKFTTKDITVTDYLTGEQIKNIPIAI